MHKEKWAHAVEGSRCITFLFCKKYLPKTRMLDLKNSQLRIGKCPRLWPWVTSWRTRPGRKHSGSRTLWRFGRDLQCFRGLPCHVMATVTLHSVFAFRIIFAGLERCQAMPASTVPPEVEVQASRKASNLPLISPPDLHLVLESQWKSYIASF